MEFNETKNNVCIKCGAELEAESLFCSVCGAKQEAPKEGESVANVPAVAPMTVASVHQPQPVQIHTLKLQGVIGVVALAALMICMPLVGSVGGMIGKDKFEGEWYYWDTEPYTFWGETTQCANLTLMKIKKVSDNAYVVTRGYISGGSGAKKEFPRNRDDSLVFFIDKEHKGIIEDTNYRNPSATLHYFYDNESKTLLNQDNMTYNPVPFTGFSEQDIKKFYDESVKATTENNKQPHRVQYKISSLDEYKSMISEMEKEMDNALQAAEKQYKTTGHAYKVKGVNQ